ncbi:hypothetical protein [Catellatospora sp. NPDC049609]|uniref:hypothetical protein n=1 Tax=Catellatospora sp. NPDC049609 TaxID=3155505 RepID=UPI0034442B3F
MAKHNQSRRHPQQEPRQHTEQDQPGNPHAEHEHGPDAHPGWTTERAQERSRQHAMASREKASRTQTSMGQANIMRLKKGNQPRGGR